jgi:DNA polymerase-3 subunit epsilon
MAPSPDFLADYRRQASAWARQVLADDQAVILDTETTGLEQRDEIIEIALINPQGATLLNTLVKPHGQIPPDVSAIHRITPADVAAAPTWPEIDAQVTALLRAASRIVIYNVNFDTRMLRHTRHRYDLPPLNIPAKRYECAMQHYAEFYGQWSNSRQSFKWQRLEGGHRALGDCMAVLKTLQKMAEVKL